MSDFIPTYEAASRAQLTYRSLPILVGYIIFAAALAFNACRVIFTRYQARQKNNDWSSPQRRVHFFLFVALAALSLSATWYYMFAFFAHSYRTWEVTRGALDTQGFDLSFASRLELWLQHTKLFREAWETVIETPARFWWSGQIFLWTTGWSVFLGLMARRYRIPHVWTYMLLGQVVAISFAQNLFFATILVSRQLRSPRIKAKDDDGYAYDLAWAPPLYCEVLPVAISLLSTVLVPSVAHTKYFMTILLIPHLLLFVPAIVRPGRFAEKGRAAARTEDQTTWRYVVFFHIFTTICVFLQAHSTFLVLEDVGTDARSPSYTMLARSLLGAIYEHPAVSSVSWDVIYCSITAVAWLAVNGGYLTQMLGGQ